MKQLFTLIYLCLCAGYGFGQDLPSCPSGTLSTIGQNPPVKSTLNLPTNPKHLREQPPFSSDRIIYWIHGLGGDTDSWARAAQATQYQPPGQQVPGYPARRVTSLPLSYSQFSLSGAASTLHNMLVMQGDPVCTANGITDKTINFIIAHSQGGIVSRATDKMYDDLGMQAERRFGGIVTFGTPHAGAMILNNKDQFGLFADEACSALIAGPLEDSIQNNPIVDFFVSNESFQSIKDGLCQIMGEQIAPIMFKGQFREITDDYKVGAAALAELNSHNADIPRVAFYGVEEEPVFYRTIYSLKVKTPNSFPTFSADPDDELVDRFNNLLNKYRSKYEQYQSMVTLLESLGLPCSPFDWVTRFEFCSEWDATYWKLFRRKNEWRKGVYWLQNSNSKYKAIIGADRSHWVNTYQCSCNGSNFPSSQPSCPPGCTLTGVSSFWQTEELPSDGVVLAESAGAYPGAISRIMLKSNHQQMRNDSNTKACLFELLEGHYGDFFRTSTR